MAMRRKTPAGGAQSPTESEIQGGPDQSGSGWDLVGGECPLAPTSPMRGGALAPEDGNRTSVVDFRTNAAVR